MLFVFLLPLMLVNKDYQFTSCRSFTWNDCTSVPQTRNICMYM